MARLSITENKLIAAKILAKLIEEQQQKADEFKLSDEYAHLFKSFQETPEMKELQELILLQKNISKLEDEIKPLKEAWKAKYNCSDYYFTPNDQMYRDRLKKKITTIFEDRNGHLPTIDEIVAEMILLAIDPANDKFGEMFKRIKKTFGL